jgi:FixJ family two-component response regulator
MNLNVSNAQIADDLEIAESTVQAMCATIREGVVKKIGLPTQPDLLLSGVIESDRTGGPGNLHHCRT